MDMRTLLGRIVRQYFIILAGTIISVAVYCTILMPEAVITIDFLWWLFFFCVLADLPGFVYYSKTAITRRQWNIRTVIHTILLEAVLLGAGKKMGIYHGIYDGIFIAVLILLVDVLVRVMTYTKDRKLADDINRKIQERRDNRHEEK